MDDVPYFPLLVYKVKTSRFSHPICRINRCFIFHMNTGNVQNELPKKQREEVLYNAYGNIVLKKYQEKIINLLNFFNIEIQL